MNDFTIIKNPTTIYCDGAATMKCINGEYVRENGGWAWAAIDENDNLIKADFGGERETTNNRMELMAVLMALKENEGNLAIHCDSAYCVNMLKPGGWIYSWVKNGWTRGKKHEPIENLDVIKEIYTQLQRGDKIDFIKVKGHAGNNWNNFVDRLAVEGKTYAYGKKIEEKILRDFPATIEVPVEQVKEEVIRTFYCTKKGI